MPHGKQSKGTCTYCEAEIGKNAAAKHLSLCLKRQSAIEKAEQKNIKTETLCHLRIQDTWQKGFWLNIEMRGSSTLGDLDFYLRQIWLECCEHLSRFSVGGWKGEEIPMHLKVDKVFRPGIELTHIYDFGTSSETLIKVVDIRQGKPTTAHPIALMVRNIMPESKCIDCGKPATRLCWECLTDDNIWGALCEEHAQTHLHSNYGDPMPLVNSPRLGMCGYAGPATPPY